MHPQTNLQSFTHVWGCIQYIVYLASMHNIFRFLKNILKKKRYYIPRKDIHPNAAQLNRFSPGSDFKNN